MTAAKGIIVDGAVTAEDDVTAKAKGDVLINSTVGAKTATLTAGNDIAIGGAVTVDTEFTAKAKGQIYETGSGVLQTKSNQDQVELEAGRGVALENKDNSFVRLNVHGTESASAPGTYNAIDGNVSITANGDRDWTVSAPEFTDKDIPVKGILATVGSPVNGNVTLTNVGEDATVVLYKNGIEANAGEAGKGNVSITADKAIVVTQGIQAANDVSVTSNTGHVFVKNSLTAKAGSANVSTGKGNIHIGANIASGQDAALKTGNGIITVDNLVASNEGNVSLTTGAGDISVNDKVIARAGSVTATTGEGDIHIGDNGPEENTVYAHQEVLLATDLGHIEISGRTFTQDGDITMKAGEDSYVEGQSNFIINQNGKVESGRDIALEGRNGDIHVTDDIVAKRNVNTIVEEQGSVYFDVDLTSSDSVSITVDKGDIYVGNTVTSTDGDIKMSTKEGDINIGATVSASKGNVVMDIGDGNIHVGANIASGQDTNLTTGSGNISVDNLVTSDDGSISLTTGAGNISVNDKIIAKKAGISVITDKGDIKIGDNGPNERTIFANQDITVATESGTINIKGRTATTAGDITLSAKSAAYTPGSNGMNIIIEDNGEVLAAGYVNLKAENGDLHVTDKVLSGEGLTAETSKQGGVYFDRSVAVKDSVSVVTDTGNISLADAKAGNDISLEIKKSGNVEASSVTAGNLVYTSTGKGDIFLDMASGKTVVIQSQANTPASHIGTIQAEAGGAGTDVAVTGNYISVGSILSKGGSDPLKVKLEAPDRKEVISEVAINNISSGSGTVIPKLWADRGTIHVSNGYLAIGDIYTTDKIHGDNPGTAFALYGRTPTGDGEPHMYWNNVDLPHRRTALLMTDSNVFTRMVDLLDEQTYTWLFERDYLKYVLAPEAPWAKHKGVLLYDRRHVVSGQRSNASEKELFSE